MVNKEQKYKAMVEYLRIFIADIAFDLADGHTHCDNTISLIIGDINEMLIKVEEEMGEIEGRN